MITHVNGSAVGDAADFYRVIGAGESGRYAFRVVRARERIIIVVNL